MYSKSNKEGGQPNGRRKQRKEKKTKGIHSLLRRRKLDPREDTDETEGALCTEGSTCCDGGTPTIKNRKKQNRIGIENPVSKEETNEKRERERESRGKANFT